MVTRPSDTRCNRTGPLQRGAFTQSLRHSLIDPSETRAANRAAGQLAVSAASLDGALTRQAVPADRTQMEGGGEAEGGGSRRGWVARGTR